MIKARPNVRRGSVLGGGRRTRIRSGSNHDVNNHPSTVQAGSRRRRSFSSDTGDYRVPLTQSFQLYHVLADNGVTTQFIACPVTGHSPTDPVDSRDTDRRWIAWLAKYLE